MLFFWPSFYDVGSVEVVILALFFFFFIAEIPLSVVGFVGGRLEKPVNFGERERAAFSALRWRSVGILEFAPRYALRDGAEWALRELENSCLR